MSNTPDEFSTNPYSATATLETADAMQPQRTYGGIGRLAYFGYTFLAGIIYNVVLAGIGAASNGAGQGGGGGGGAVLALVGLALLAYFAALMVIVAQRMINCGYSPWWCVGIIIPILNILVGFRCIACPEGYADHKTLDTAGKVLLGIFIVAFLAVVALVFVGVAAQ